MTKKAIIYDLDNTIYPASSIGPVLFAPVLTLIQNSGEHHTDMEGIKKDILRKPFQHLAAKYNFSEALTNKGINLLQHYCYEGVIAPFPDYKENKNLPGEKYLVTTGFVTLQRSKIKQLGIEQDFKEIHIVDPQTSAKTKKDVFADIIQRNNHDVSEVLVIGDDPESEIKAAIELGIDVVLYDPFHFHPGNITLPKITNFKELILFL